MISPNADKKPFRAEITVERVDFDPRRTTCETCGSGDNLRSITGFVVCKDCLEGGQ
jgi:hypothetical protein